MFTNVQISQVDFLGSCDWLQWLAECILSGRPGFTCLVHEASLVSDIHWHQIFQ